MTIEEEIAQILHANNCRCGHQPTLHGEPYWSMAVALSPLLNRVRAEARANALREAREAVNHTRNVPSLIKLADKFGGYHQGQRSGLEMAEAVIARIEQNSEGNET